MSDTPKERETATMGSRPIAKRLTSRYSQQKMVIGPVNKDAPLTKNERAIVRARIDLSVPQTRGDCPAQRPCRHIMCRHHLWPTHKATQPTAFVSLELDWMSETCALDCADRDGMTLDEIGKILGLTRERVRHIQDGALEKLREEFGDDSLMDLLPTTDEADPIVPEVGDIAEPEPEYDPHGIDDRRRALGLTRRDLAALAGLSAATIARVTDRPYVDGVPRMPDGRRAAKRETVDAVLRALDEAPEKEPAPSCDDVRRAFLRCGCTVSEVAKEARSSAQSVKWSMDERRRVRPETARRVLAAMVRLAEGE